MDEFGERTCPLDSDNPNFNYGEFATIRNQSGLNSFKISVKEFVARTGAISLQAKAAESRDRFLNQGDRFLNEEESRGQVLE